MRWNDHSAYAETHSMLSASQYHWINDDIDRFNDRYVTKMAAEKGTRLHAFAAEAIALGIKLEGENTLALHVNDAINFKMDPEVILMYSPRAYATTDAIQFYEHDKFLRIHDLKTGLKQKGHFEQLRIYAAYFCLEYEIDPYDIDIELRIYQFDTYRIENPEKDKIANIMETIVIFNNEMDRLEEEKNVIVQPYL